MRSQKISRILNVVALLAALFVVTSVTVFAQPALPLPEPNSMFDFSARSQPSDPFGFRNTGDTVNYDLSPRVFTECITAFYWNVELIESTTPHWRDFQVCAVEAAKLLVWYIDDGGNPYKTVIPVPAGKTVVDFYDMNWQGRRHPIFKLELKVQGGVIFDRVIDLTNGW